MSGKSPTTGCWPWVRPAPRGTVLLLALLIMSGVLITGASLATISVLTLRQSRVIDDSVTAFAAAESGSEQSLYLLRRVGASPSYLNLHAIHGDDAAGTGPAMSNGSSWRRASSGTENTLYTDINKDKAYELVLWDPEAPSSAPGIESLKFTWNDECGGLSGLEVFAVGWNPAAGGTSPFNADIDTHGDSTALTYLRDAAGVIDNAYIAGRAYRVQLRAKVCNIRSLGITAWDADNATGSLVNIPSRIAVTTTGEFVSARQSMEVRLPRLQPLTGAFNFVIFSQCSILKGLTGGPPCT